MNEYRRQQLAAARLIEQGATAEQIAEVYGWTARATPERSGTTGHNRALTPRIKCGIIKAIKRHLSRRKKQEVNKMAKMYIESDNGGRSIMICKGKKWYMCDCAPSGCFGDVDILGGTEEEAAARMRKAIDAGDIYDENDCAENLDTLRYIPDYTGLSAKQIERRENNGRTCDFMTLTEI